MNTLTLSHVQSVIYRLSYQATGGITWTSSSYQANNASFKFGNSSTFVLGFGFNTQKDFLNQQGELTFGLPMSVQESDRYANVTLDIVVSGQGPNRTLIWPTEKIYSRQEKTLRIDNLTSVHTFSLALNEIETNTKTFYVWIRAAVKDKSFYVFTAPTYKHFLTYAPVEFCKWKNSTITFPSNTNYDYYLKPSGSKRVVEWERGTDASNNEVEGYKVSWYYDQEEECIGAIEVFEPQAEIEFSNLLRNKKIAVSVQIIGSTSDERYKYSPSISTIIGCVNNQPRISAFATQSLYPQSEKMHFSVAVSDDDVEQALTYSYKIDNGGYINNNSGSTLIVDNSELNLNAGEHKITFKGNDGLEDSSEVVVSFNVNNRPKITSTTINYIPLAGYTGDNLLSIQGSIIYELNKTLELEKVKFSYRVNNKTEKITTVLTEEQANQIFGANAIQKTINYNLSVPCKISDIIKNGDIYTFGFRVYDGIEWSEWVDFTQQARYPSLMEEPNITIATDRIDEQLAKENYFYSNMLATIVFNEPASNSGCVNLDSVLVRGSQQQGDVTIAIAEQRWNINYGASKNLLIPIQIIDPSPSEPYKILLSLEITDAIGQKRIYVYNRTFYYVGDLVFENANLAQSMTEIKPLSNLSELKLSHRKIYCEGSEVKYEYKVTTNGQEYILQNRDYSSNNTSSETAEITIEANRVNQILISLFNQEERGAEYSATWTVAARDGFGRRQEARINFTIDFLEAPSWSGDESIILKHDYDISNQNLNSTDIKIVEPVSGNNYQLNVRMFNPGEGLIFYFPKPLDLNENTSSGVEEYCFYWCRRDVANKEVANLPNIAGEYDSSPFLTVKAAVLESNKVNINGKIYYQYRYAIPYHSKNYSYFFAIKAKDRRGNLSIAAIYSNTYIIGCRATAPVFNIQNFQLSRVVNEKQEPQSIVVNNKIEIVDLGGSSANFWSEDYYNVYNNLERDFLNNIKKIGLKIELSSSKDFSANVYGQWIIEDQEAYLRFKNREFEIRYSLKPNEPNSIDEPAIFEKKLYVRFTLALVSGINMGNNPFLDDDDEFENCQVLFSTSKAFVNYNQMPTVSYRPHRTGINITEEAWSQNDVFAVSSYNDNNYENNLVRFLGESTLTDTAQAIEIVFNLAQATLDGVIISGGTW